MTGAIDKTILEQKLAQSAYFFDRKIVYDYIYDCITDKSGSSDVAAVGVDASVWLWVKGARQVNDVTDNSYFTTFIREYTAEQYRLRTGALIPSNFLQNTSNQIANTFALDIINRNGNLPNLHDLGAIDAGQAASTIFGNNYSPWAGTILFPFLGDSSFTQNWLLSNGTSNYKLLSGSYDLVSVAAAAHIVANAWSAYFNSDDLRDTINGNSDGATATLSHLQSLRHDANVFFQEAYGLPDDEARFQIGGDLPLYGPDDYIGGADYFSHPNYVVGILGDDTGIHAVTSTPGNDIINAGTGNDFIQGSDGKDLIDGGEGWDTISYQYRISALTIEFQTVSGTLYQERLYVIKTPVGDGMPDFLYGIENIIATDYDDKITADSQNNIIYGGGGSDIIHGGAGNDVIDGGGDGNDILYGGSGADVFVWDINYTGTIRIAEWDASDIVQLVGTDRSSITGFYDGAGNGVFTSSVSGATLIVERLQSVKGSSVQSLVIADSASIIHTATAEAPTRYEVPVNGASPGALGATIAAIDLIPDEPEPPAPVPDAVGQVPILLGQIPWQTMSPLMIDMDGDGIEMTNALTNPVYWDVDNDGFKEASAWVKADDALLAIDLNGNGIIDNHNELFGTNTVDGFSILRGLDSNGDGRIDMADTQFNKLQVWQDANQDAYSQANELKTLAQAGIQSINLNATQVSYQVAGNDVTHTSTVTMTDNSTKNIVDAWFKYDMQNTEYAGPQQAYIDASSLPGLRGYGEIKDLLTQAGLDPVLHAQIIELAQMDAASILNADFNFDMKFANLMYQWSGETLEQYRMHSMGADSRKFGFLQDMSAQAFGQYIFFSRENPDLGVQQGGSFQYTGTWQKMLTHFSSHFVIQTGFGDLFTGTPVYHAHADTVTGATGLSQTGLTHYASIINNTSDHAYGWAMLVRVIEGAIGISHLSATDYTALDNAIQASAIGETLATVYHNITETNALQDFGNGITLTGTTGDDTFYGSAGSHTFNSGRGDDRLYGDASDDVYNSGAGDDYMEEYNYANSNDIYNYHSGNDIIWDYAGNDKLVMPIGVLLSDINISLSMPYTSGSEDMIVTIKNLGSVIIKNINWGMTSGIETVVYNNNQTIDLKTLILPQIGDEYNNVLVGQDRNHYLGDHLIGNDGDDTLNGGVGLNQLEGGAGSDTYVYAGGIDFITDKHEYGPNDDTLVFSSNYDPNKISFRAGYDSQWAYNGGLAIYYDNKLAVYISSQFDGGSIEHIIFANHYTLDMSTQSFAQYGSSDGDLMNGLSYGGLQDAILYGLGGNDELRSYSGNDTLDGGTGNDILDGGGGCDTYIYSGGIDTIYETGNDRDILKFGIGITAANLSFSRSGQSYENLDILVDGRLAVVLGGAGTLMNVRVETAAFVDGTTLDLTQFGGVVGTESNDIIMGRDLVGNISDALYGFGGNDTLIGGAGNDLLFGDAGDDTYIYTSGIDRVSEKYGYSNSFWAGGTDTLLFGQNITASNLTFEIKNIYNVAQDLLIKINGLDAVIIESQFNTNLSTVEYIRFYDGSTIDLLAKSYVIDGTAGNDILNGIDFGGLVTSINGLDGDDYINGRSLTDIINGGNGNDYVYGGDGDDTIHGDAGIDSLSGGEGNDTIFGDAGDDALSGDSGDDILFGGTGIDTLSGGYGNDIFVVANDGSVDVLFDNAGTDQVNLAADFSSANMIYLRDGQDLRLIHNGLDIARLGYFFSSADNIENIHFDNGNIFDLRNLQFTTNGTMSSDYLAPSYGFIQDEINGLDGNDYIYGYGGNDVLNGGNGNDTLDGGIGDDRYVINFAEGGDRISDTAGNDTIEMGAGFLASAMTYIQDGYDLLLMHNSDEAARIIGYFNEADSIETIRFSNNDVVNLSDLTFTLDGTNNDDYIYMGQGNVKNIIHGHDGNDYIYAGAGDDIVHGGNGDDFLSGGAGHDILYGDAGNNYLYGDNGNDQIFGGSEHDLIYGGIGNDTLWGDAGNDTISGDDGSDLIYGGADDDHIYADGGDDSVYGDAGDDVIYVGSGNNIAHGGDGNDQIHGDYYGSSTIFGDAGDDLLYSFGNDHLYGGSGNDTLHGYGTTAHLSGGDGMDLLFSDTGTNVLSGGDGSDTFSFSGSSAYDGVDSITDFNTVEGDVLNLADLLYGYQSTSDNIDDFVHITSVGGGNSMISVDIDGIGNNYSSFDVTTINLSSGITANDLMQSGSLVTHY